MRIAVLGTGVVGRTIATKLVQLGHDVTVGSRSQLNPAADAWKFPGGRSAAFDTFAGAAAAGDLIFNCTNGAATLTALDMAGPRNFDGKVLVDVANPLDFSTGSLRLIYCNGDSLGERIQAALPDTKVVKALNTVTAPVMVDAGRVPGDHVLPICGNDEEAKQAVRDLVACFGWDQRRIVDLGDITAARAQEAHLFMWLALADALDTYEFNFGLAVRSK